MLLGVNNHLLAGCVTHITVYVCCLALYYHTIFSKLVLFMYVHLHISLSLLGNTQHIQIGTGHMTWRLPVSLPAIYWTDTQTHS